MIGQDQGLFSLKCDLCGRVANGVIFAGIKAIDKYIKNNGWVEITTDENAPLRNVKRHICHVCIELILQAKGIDITPPEVSPPPKKQKPQSKNKISHVDETEPTVETGENDGKNI